MYLRAAEEVDPAPAGEATAAPSPKPTHATLPEQIDALLAAQKREEKVRKIALWVTVGGLVFTASRVALLALEVRKRKRECAR